MENAEKSKLLAFFNALREDDKDIVLAMAESLVEKYKGSMANKAENNAS